MYDVFISVSQSVRKITDIHSKYVRIKLKTNIIVNLNLNLLK